MVESLFCFCIFLMGHADSTQSKLLEAIPNCKPAADKSRILLLGGGASPGNLHFTAESFYPSQPEKNRLEPRPAGPEIEFANDQQAQVHKGNIYLVGGFEVLDSRPPRHNDPRMHISNTTYIINVANWSVSYGPDTIAPRATAGSALVKNSMFLCGGTDQRFYYEDDLHILNSCEILTLDQPNATWELVAPMIYGRVQHAMAALDGEIFAMGGWVVSEEGSTWIDPSESGDTSTVESYSVAENKWTMLGSSMLRQYVMTSVAVVFNGHITVCGEWLNKHHACEFYNNGKWEWFSLPNGMVEVRDAFTMVEWNGKLVALGNNGNWRLTPDPNATSVEIFDPEIGKWSLCENRLIGNRWFATAVVV